MTDGRLGVSVHGAAVFVYPCVGGVGATFIPSSDHLLDPEICEGIAMLQLPVLNNQRSGAIGGLAAGGRGGGRGRSVDDGTRARLAKELVALLEGTGSEVRFGTHDRLLYATDASLYQEEPIGVVIPASVQDAARVVGWCHREGVAVLPRGGGTSLAGQCTSHAVVIDCSPNCRAVGDVKWDREASACEAKARAASGRGTMPGAWEGAYVEVEPGCTVDELNEELARRGEKLFFAPDPATSRQAAIGGCLGNNAAGSRSVRYGRTSENVLAIEAAIPVLGGERVWLEAGAPRASEVAVRVTEVVARHAAEIRARFPKTIRRNAGYGLDMVLAQMDAGVERERVSLTPLLCGSEGTLALTTRARLKLMPTPSAKGLMVVSFATLEHAIAAVKPILDRGVAMGLSAVELLDDVVLDAARGNIQYRKYVELLPGANEELRDPKAVLYIEFFAFEGGSGGTTPNAQLEQGFVAIADVLRSLGDDSGVIPNGIAKYTDTGAMLKAWALRKAGEPLLHGLPGARKPITFVEDNAVPVERLSEFVRRFKEIVGRHGTRAAYWAHASVGVLHVRPMIDLHDPADRERMVAIAVEVADLARDCGGVMSGEHGDGKVRGPLIERFFGPELVRAFREVKQAFDPKGIMNPGNIVGPYGAPETIASGLRVDAARGMQSLGEAPGHDHDSTHAHGHHTHHADGHAEGESGTHASHREQTGIETYFDYADQHGFGHAVEMCNGAGVCRKRSGGTMCPSYMATQDERHSTRGRGNALRLAMSGQVNLVDRDGVGIAGRGGGAPVFDDAETIETLHLCLSCKACKSECPSNVDIARLKAEYTAQRYKERGGASVIAKLFGHVRTLNRLGSLTPGLTNWVNGLSVTKMIARRVMGIDERRSLPRFERSLWARLRDEKKRTSTKNTDAASTKVNDDRPVVVLYADCFTAYNEPEIGVAAVRVLEAFGYRVRVLPNEGTLLDGEWGGSGCCGRAMISTGLLPEAIRTADSTLEILREAAEDPNVRAVVVCEPSCLSAIKDDWLQLKLSTPMRLRKALAAKSFLVEEFLEKAWNAHPKRPEALQADKSSPVLLHAHCHQKALWGAESSAGILRRLLGDRLKVLDTGCCGMAGSFGFTADRYDLSQRIGELSLMPALRGASDGAKVCAPGTSCRHQIHDAAAAGTAGGKHADHPIQVIADVLGLR